MYSFSLSISEHHLRTHTHTHTSTHTFHSLPPSLPIQLIVFNVGRQQSHSLYHNWCQLSRKFIFPVMRYVSGGADCSQDDGLLYCESNASTTQAVDCAGASRRKSKIIKLNQPKGVYEYHYTPPGMVLQNIVSTHLDCER